MGLHHDRAIGHGAKHVARPRSRGKKRLGNATTPPVYVSTRKGREALERMHAKAPEDWRPIDKAFRGDWLRHRLREYVNVHGYASAGVCTLLEKAAAAYADGDYIRALGMQQNDMDLVMQSHKLSNHAKGLELAAFEIAVREGKAKQELDAMSQQGSSRLAHVLSETEEERAQANRSRKPKKPLEFGGVVFTTDDPWPGVGAGQVEAMFPPEGPPGGGQGRGTPLPPSSSPTPEEPEE